MQNVHGINDYSSDSRGRHQQMGQEGNGLSMMGISQQDFQLMGRQVMTTRVPFMNIMTESGSPLDQTIPQTLKLVWCPDFHLLSCAAFVLLVIWILYIVCLTQGIDTLHYDVLAPTPQTLRTFGAYNYQLLKDGEVWRLIVAAFLHYDLLQITMSSISILFFVTQLESCFNPLLVGVVMLVSAVSGNITTAVFANMVSLNCGSGTMVYGVLGGFFAYLALNWQSLYLIRGQLACIFGMMAFFAMLFSIGGIYGFANFCGAFLGGFLCSLGIFKPIRERNLILVIGGLTGVALYWLMMFLIFYLAL